MKVRVDQQGVDQWVMTPEFKKSGSPSSNQGRFMFRGDDEAFRRQLIKMQVKDTDSNPDSHRDISYKDMVQTFKVPKRTYCWMYSNKWEPNNKFKEDVKESFVPSMGTIDDYLSGNEPYVLSRTSTKNTNLSGSVQVIVGGIVRTVFIYNLGFGYNAYLTDKDTDVQYSGKGSSPKASFMDLLKNLKQTYREGNMREMRISWDTRDRYRVDWWQERDRASVVVYDQNDKDVWEAWDENVHELIEDGFIKWEDNDSVLEYLLSLDIIREGKNEMTNLSVPQKHQKAIAIKTLKMNDVGASIMGGMDKEQARAFLKSIGYSDNQIANIEESTVKDNIIEVKEDVKIPETDIILEKGDQIKVLTEGQGFEFMPGIGISDEYVINNDGEYIDASLNLWVGGGVEDEYWDDERVLSLWETKSSDFFNAVDKIMKRKLSKYMFDSSGAEYFGGGDEFMYVMASLEGPYAERDYNPTLTPEDDKTVDALVFAVYEAQQAINSAFEKMFDVSFPIYY